MPLDVAEDLPVAWREDAIVADPDKPTWEYVLGKQSQKGINGHGHDTMFPSLLVLFVVVGYLRVCDVQYSGVGDGHTPLISTPSPGTIQ